MSVRKHDNRTAQRSQDNIQYVRVDGIRPSRPVRIDIENDCQEQRTCNHGHGPAAVLLEINPHAVGVIYRVAGPEQAGGQETVMTLLAEKVEIDFTTHDSYTALAYAAGAGHLDLVKLLLKRGADVNKRGWLAKTPFAVAVEGGHLEVLKFLVAQKADIHTRVQHGGGMINDAVFWGQPEVLEYLISLGLPVNDAPPRNLWTPLHNATWRLTRGPEHLRERFAACVKILLAHGADKNAKNRDGQTPLSIYGGVTGVAGPLFEEK